VDNVSNQFGRATGRYRNAAELFWLAAGLFYLAIVVLLAVQ
jgi:hypothetical protein